MHRLGEKMSKAKLGVNPLNILTLISTHKIRVVYNHLFLNDWDNLVFVSASEHDSLF